MAYTSACGLVAVLPLLLLLAWVGGARQTIAPLPCHHPSRSASRKISVTWLGPVPQVTVMEPELVKEVLFAKYGDFAKPNGNPLANLFLRGLVAYDGEKWAKHRKILNPAFHRMLPAFSVCCIELMSSWEDMVGSEGYYEIDVWPDLQAFTGNVISRAAFGSSYEDGRRIYHLQTEQARLIKAIGGEIKEIIGSLIKKREEDMKAGKARNENNDDLLGLLMESNMNHSREHGNKNTKLTTEDVIEECKLFYFAGQETTSVLLTWTMILLSMHQSWQVRAREEVLQTFGKNNIPSYDDLSHLKIVTMILNEVLRLYPPAPILHRRTYKTVKLGNVVYPPGVLVALPILLIHHDPDIWGKDASEFNPDRFAQGVSNASKDKNAYFAFGFGPRICIGQNFALIEARLAICMILQRFSFELSPSYAHAPYRVITLHPQHGAQIKMHRL
ncbi:hypothetical protein Cni_G00217 [Canna indica]|uniref:Cytochrome P450 n=1 Tax=Canna indica TaxID=4628 RepID=A0AAQ3JM89_9LILI|nr:hypothetical protein Cni_G00217 [Canna indica]